MKVYYFGCWDVVGHYAWTPDAPYARPRQAGPWSLGDLDAGPVDWRGPTGRGVVPEDPEQREGVWRLTHRDGWTAIGAWDRTVDRRGGSKAVFVAEGEHDLPAMERIAAEHFPKVWARITRAR